MSTPVYDLVLVAHVVAAVVGFGALAAGGVAASSGRRCADPATDESVLRFFKPGRDWPARVIFLVPVLGLVLLLGGDRSSLHDLWPWLGLGIWLAAAAVTTAAAWPAERRAQELLASLGAAAEAGAGAEAGADVEQFRRACRTMERAAGVSSVCFVVAVLVMVLQP